MNFLQEDGVPLMKLIIHTNTIWILLIFLMDGGKYCIMLEMLIMNIIQHKMFINKVVHLKYFSKIKQKKEHASQQQIPVKDQQLILS